MAKQKKTMRITLTEDFLVPTDDGNIIFEPGDEIEVEYDDVPDASDDIFVDDDEFEDDPVTDTLMPDPEADPLSFAANDNADVYDDIEDPAEEIATAALPVETPDDEVYIEDPYV